MNLKLIVFASVVTTSVSANAAINWHTTLGSWNTATGGAVLTEDFSSFGTDTEFRTQAVAINGGSLSQLGLDGAFRNMIDVPTTQFSDNNGTTHASMFVQGDAPDTTVQLTFDANQTAFGFESWGAAGGEGATIEVYNGTTLVGSMALTNGSGDFFGFDLTGGDQATHVVWRATTADTEPLAGEGFGTDNYVYGQPVPEPATMIALGLGAAAIMRRRARK